MIPAPVDTQTRIRMPKAELPTLLMLEEAVCFLVCEGGGHLFQFVFLI